jgi:hypothetical protein
MKRFIFSQRWKKFLSNRSKKTKKRKNKRERKRRRELEEVKRMTRSITIESPAILSFIFNLEPTVEFFNKIEKAMLSGNSIKLDLSKITNLTGDSILYLLSSISNSSGARLIRGNNPNNSSARNYLQASGFYNYVNAQNYAYRPIDQNFFAIRRGALVETDILSHAINFSISKSNNNSQITRFLKNQIYRSLNEGMGNVIEHAYSKNKITKYWWLMVEYLEKERKLRFYVLDNGVGIPTTIAKKFKEKAYEILYGLFSNHSDSEYILSALRGEFRSETKKKNRGYGLPEVREIAENKNISSFKIISNYGYVDVKLMRGQNLPSRIYGSLLTWEIDIK